MSVHYITRRAPNPGTPPVPFAAMHIEGDRNRARPIAEPARTHHAWGAFVMWWAVGFGSGLLVASL